MLEWLGEHYREIGAISSIVFGISSASIAFLAYRLNFRNNWGWKPLIVVGSWGFSTDAKGASLTANFDVWNRHKYPIAIYAVRLQSRAVTFKKDLRAVKCGGDIWRINSSGQAYSFPDLMLEPGKHRVFRVDLPIAEGGTTIDAPRCEMRYLDPISGRIIEMASDDRKLKEWDRYYRRWQRQERPRKPPPWLRPPRQRRA